MSASHSKRGATRAALTRKTTRGPLDAEDPLSTSLNVSPSTELSASPLAASAELDAPFTTPSAPSQPEPVPAAPSPYPTALKDLSFLLDASIYHPLSNIDVPPPYRVPLPPPPPPTTPLVQVFTDLDRLLKQCHFLPAAHLAATALTSGLVQPGDATSIFRLLSIRYSTLELSGNFMLAAQESKALEDLSSSFYYDDAKSSDDNIPAPQARSALPKHIMPFDLRLQTMRLQGIGFGDSRRTVGALFDLGLECRQHLAYADQSERKLWTDRLQEVGVRVVNALIDLGDLDCTRRTLSSITSEISDSVPQWMARLVLLQIKMGEINEARQMLTSSPIDHSSRMVLQSFIEVADGNFEAAVKTLAKPVIADVDRDSLAIAKQNLAVAYLYVGEIGKSQQILEALVDDGYSFQALTVNLATLYDLTSDKSAQMKVGLANKIANITPSGPQRAFVNADFKL